VGDVEVELGRQGCGLRRGCGGGALGSVDTSAAREASSSEVAAGPCGAFFCACGSGRRGAGNCGK
jgi:hypothetical protein